MIATLHKKGYAKLLEWKNRSPKSKAIMVEGARRVGKSFLVEDFAKNEYKSLCVNSLNPTTTLLENANNNSDGFAKLSADSPPDTENISAIMSLNVAKFSSNCCSCSGVIIKY